jgi:GT2 family glycosyltransferase
MYGWFFMHFEEIDMCWRMHACGYQVACSNESIAWHVGGGTLEYESPRKTFLNFRNNLVMYIRNTPAFYLFFWIPFRFLLDSLAACTYLLKKQPNNFIAVYQAWWACLVWLCTEKNKFPLQKKALFYIDTSFKGSIIWEYYLRNKKRFVQLKQ